MTSIVIDPEYVNIIENVDKIIIPNHIKEAGFDMVFEPVLFDCYSVWRHEFLKHVGYWNLPKNTINRCDGDKELFKKIKEKF